MTLDAKTTALQVIADICGVERDSLKPETQLVADLGVDSARALHLLVKLEDELGVEIDDEDVADLQTVGNVLDFIDRQPTPDAG